MFLSEVLYIGVIHLLSDSLNEKGASPITQTTQIPGDNSFTFRMYCKKRSLYAGTQGISCVKLKDSRELHMQQ